MKRPRRPVKKKPRKVTRKKIVKRCTKRDVPHRKIDPFWIDPRKVPAGWGYAWKPNARPGGELPLGWSAVPFSRHAHDFPRNYQVGSCIVHGGLILAEALSDQIESEQWALTQAAKDQLSDVFKRYGIDQSGSNSTRFVGGLIEPETEEIPEDARQNEGAPIELCIWLPLRVPVRWRSAAAYLNLPFEEYVRRRILMLRPVLGCVTRWDGASDLTGFYEPVQLSFSPLNKPKES